MHVNHLVVTPHRKHQEALGHEKFSFLFQNSAATFTANYTFRIDFRWWSVTSGNFLTKLTRIWQVGGVHFPPCILSSYRIPSSHTTPFTVEECAKGTSRLCLRVSRWWKVSFMFLCAPKSPETWDSTKSLIHQLTEVIQAWRYWYANMVVQLQVCWSGLYPKSHGSTPDTFLFRSHNDPPVNGPCERLAPVRVHRIQTHMD